MATVAQPETQPRQLIPSLALAAAAIGFVLAFVTTPGQSEIRFIAARDSGEFSLTSLLLLLSLGLGVVITAIAYRYNRQDAPDQSSQGRSNLIARLSTALAASLILFTVSALAMYGIAMLFQGLMLDRLFVIVAATLYAGVVSLALATWSANIQSVNLLRLAGVMALTGIALAALAVGDPQWWQRSLSYLGSTETAGFYFNIALILTGLLILVVNEETLSVLRSLVERDLVENDYVSWVRIFLIAIPVCIVGVGLFPTRITPLSDLLHNLSSHLMFVFFVILMLTSVNRRDSFHPQSFRQLSRLFAWVLLLFLALEKLEVVNFVAFELIILVPIGIWLAAYQNQVYTLERTGRAPEVRISDRMTPPLAYALRAGFITATLGGVIALLFVGREDAVNFVNVEQQVTLGNLWVVLSLFVGAAVPALAYRRFIIDKPDLSDAERESMQSRRYWLDRAVVSMTASVIVFALTIGLVLAIDLFFPGVALNLIGAIAATAVYSGILGSLLAVWVTTLDNVNLLILSGITVFLGIAAAALFMGDPEWWRISLSYLGSSISPVSMFFNLALILAGLIVLAVNQDAVALLRVLRDDGRVSADYFMNVRWLLMLIPLFLMAVGLFPRRISDLYDLLHNLSATAMVFCYMILAFFAIGRASTIHQRRFVQQSRLLVLVVILLFGIYVLGVANYVGFELLLFIPVGIWLLLYQFELRQFARNSSQMSGQTPETLSPA